jgi:hypothetical protein
MRRIARVKKECGACSIGFEVPISRQDTAKYCSDSCRIACLRPKDYVCTPEHARAISLGKTGKSVPKLQGENNFHWKGDRVTYSGLHHWIKKQAGSPCYCEHCGETSLRSRQYHWANKSQQYKRDVEDWLRLCAKCHKKYDKDKIKNKPSVYA